MVNIGMGAPTVHSLLASIMVNGSPGQKLRPKTAQDDSMYGFAQVVSMSMFGGIALSVCMMIFMTSVAIFYRSALGGLQELLRFVKTCQDKIGRWEGLEDS